MNDPGLSQLLKWSIENSAAGENADGNTDAAAAAPPRSQLNPELLAQLLGGPSDADRMRDAMAAIYSDEVDLENKLIAWDNFEQLVENLDNANNMETLGLWMPLIGKLDDAEAEVRNMALWCLGTAVQNNIKCQEKVSCALAEDMIVVVARYIYIHTHMLTRSVSGTCHWRHPQDCQAEY